MGKGINIIQTNCTPEDAKDTSLPRDSYLVTYGDNGVEKYDIVQGLKLDIFDQYWDKYGNFIGMVWTEGTANPKMWGYQSPQTKKRK